MVFTSTTFVLFLPLVLGLYFATNVLFVRQLLLVVASCIFYGFWDYRFVALLLYVTATAYLGGQAVARFPERKKATVGWVIALQLTPLLFFKYTNFLLGSLVDVAQAVGVNLGSTHFSIALPIGISFYTFHGISYVVDVYRGKIERPQSLLVVALYIAFFPQLVAGPIVRADVFLPQSKVLQRLDTRDVIVGAKFIVLGLIYKSVFADRLAPLVDVVFQKPHKFDNLTLASAALGFYSQIYFDFAGYSTMAIGISRLFGFKLPKNFDYPYRSTSITTFWKRWHISLSSWLRDYLYIPLGGNRQGTVKQYRNLMLTMLLGGLWHGASYNFVLWGGLHGAALSVHKFWLTRFPWAATPARARIARLAAAWIVTQLFVCITWIPFRADSFGDTALFLQALIGVRNDAGLRTEVLPLPLLLIPILVDHLFVQNPALPAIPWPKKPMLIVAILALCLALTLPLLTLKVQSFIYFQF